MPTNEADKMELSNFVQSLWGGKVENDKKSPKNDVCNVSISGGSRISSDVHGYLKVVKTAKVLLPKPQMGTTEVPDNIECRICHKIIKLRLCSMRIVSPQIRNTRVLK